MAKQYKTSAELPNLIPLPSATAATPASAPAPAPAATHPAVIVPSLESFNEVSFGVVAPPSESVSYLGFYHDRADESRKQLVRSVIPQASNGHPYVYNGGEILDAKSCHYQILDVSRYWAVREADGSVSDVVFESPSEMAGRREHYLTVALVWIGGNPIATLTTWHTALCRAVSDFAAAARDAASPEWVDRAPDDMQRRWRSSLVGALPPVFRVQCQLYTAQKTAKSSGFAYTTASGSPRVIPTDQAQRLTEEWGEIGAAVALCQQAYTRRLTTLEG